MKISESVLTVAVSLNSLFNYTLWRQRHKPILFCDELWRQQKMALAAITHFLLKEIISLLDFVGLFLQLFLNARALVSHDLRLFLCWLCKGGSHWIWHFPFLRKYFWRLYLARNSSWRLEIKKVIIRSYIVEIIFQCQLIVFRIFLIKNSLISEGKDDMGSSSFWISNENKCV